MITEKTVTTVIIMIMLTLSLIITDKRELISTTVKSIIIELITAISNNLISRISINPCSLLIYAMIDIPVQYRNSHSTHKTKMFVISLK